MNGLQENAAGPSSLRVVMLVLPIVRCDPSKPIPECGFVSLLVMGLILKSQVECFFKVLDLECLRVAFI